MVLTAYILITSKLTLSALSPQTSSSCSLWLTRYTHGCFADTLQFSLLLYFFFNLCHTIQQFSLINNLEIILDSSKTFRPLAIQAPSLDTSFSHLFFALFRFLYFSPMSYCYILLSGFHAFRFSHFKLILSTSSRVF